MITRGAYYPSHMHKRYRDWVLKNQSPYIATTPPDIWRYTCRHLSEWWWPNCQKLVKHWLRFAWNQQHWPQGYKQFVLCWSHLSSNTYSWLCGFCTWLCLHGELIIHHVCIRGKEIGLKNRSPCIVTPIQPHPQLTMWFLPVAMHTCKQHTPIDSSKEW